MCRIPLIEALRPDSPGRQVCQLFHQPCSGCPAWWPSPPPHPPGPAAGGSFHSPARLTHSGEWLNQSPDHIEQGHPWKVKHNLQEETEGSCEKPTYMQCLLKLRLDRSGRDLNANPQPSCCETTAQITVLPWMSWHVFWGKSRAMQDVMWLITKSQSVFTRKGFATILSRCVNNVHIPSQTATRLKTKDLSEYYWKQGLNAGSSINHLILVHASGLE